MKKTLSTSSRAALSAALLLTALTAPACGDDAEDPGPQNPEFPATLEERGYSEVRAIMHLHSAFSHDACDDEGLDEDGNPNWTCIRRMKASLCEEEIGVALMTDHPSFMDEQAFEDLPYAELDEGDELLKDGQGEAWGVRYACPAGQGVGGRAVLIPGFEGTHTMPMGLRRHLTDHSHYGVSLKNDTDPTLIDAMVSDVKASGGFVGVAHSEDDDIDASVIAGHDIAAMELYNFHANFQEVMGDDLATALFGLDPFLDLDASTPHPDLAALVMLGTYPIDALTKFREVSFVRPITAFAGSDVHENVLIPAICVEDFCSAWEEDYPNLVRFLSEGGSVTMSDGDRLDSYGRIFRWVQNRVWTAPGQALPFGVEDGLMAGRNVVVFEVLGDAVGTSLLATTDGEDGLWEYHDMGATVGVDDGATLWARTPDLPRPGRTARWTDASAAEMTATLWRTDADGSVAVQTWTEPATWISLPLDTPGSYQLEVTLVPKHLAAELGPVADRANDSYRWVETNAIRVE